MGVALALCSAKKICHSTFVSPASFSMAKDCLRPKPTFLSMVDVIVIAVPAANVVKIFSSPYDVPSLFVAYARTWYIVEAVNPVRVDMNTPEPMPSEVFGSAMVGEPVMFQQQPRAVTGAPPSSKMVEPEVALVDVIDDRVFVISVGYELAYYEGAGK